MLGNASSDVLQVSQSRGFLALNRFSAGDAGFASNFDFVSGDGAVESKLAAAAARQPTACWVVKKTITLWVDQCLTC